MSEAEIRKKLRGWILARASAAEERLGSDELPILEEGLLSSLDIVEFILFIESLRGEEVEIEAIEPDVFTSINSLYKAFFENVPV